MVSPQSVSNYFIKIAQFHGFPARRNGFKIVVTNPEEVRRGDMFSQFSDEQKLSLLNMRCIVICKFCGTVCLFDDLKILHDKCIARPKTATIESDLRYLEVGIPRWRHSRIVNVTFSSIVIWFG